MRIHRSGTILITSLWVLIILSMLACGIGFRVSIEARLSKYNMDRLKAYYLARSGIVKCQELLSNDNNNYDSIYENGIILSGEEKFNEIFMNIKPLESEGGHFDISYSNAGINDQPGMMDEERKVNINKASAETLKSLLEIVAQENRIALDPGSFEEIAASIVSWRSPGPGADDSYYESLPYPYQNKHGNFSVAEELLLVKGVDPGIFNAIKDYITVFGFADGRININTASKEVLMALGMSEALVDKVIRFRNSSDGEPGTKDDEVFLDVNTIPTVLKANCPQGLTEEEALSLGGLISNRCFTVTSNYFRIESNAVMDVSKIGKRIVCIVYRDPVKKGANKLISYREF